MKAKSLKNLSRRPKLLAMLTLFCLLAGGLNLKAQQTQTLTVCNGSETNDHVPIYGEYCDEKSKCEFIIPAEKLSAMNGGVISAMKFYLSSSGNYDQISPTFNVFVKEVSTTTLTGFTGTTNATSVYTSTISIPKNQSNFVLDIPFSSNYIYGGGDLLIGVYQTGSSSYNQTNWTGESQSGNTAWQGYGSGSGSAEKFLPKTTFTYTPGTTPYISLAPSSATVLTGFTETLTATTLNVTGTPSISYTTSNASIATVSGSGTTATVTAVAPGMATITASMTYQGTTYTATSAITVENPSYCTPSYSETSDYIKSFVTTGGNTNINNTNTGQGTGGYSDFYNSHSASIEVGQTLSFTVTRGNTYSYKYAIWVDWNHDCVFDVNTETMAQQTTSVKQDWSSSFTIPVGTAAGDYRMRVEMLYGSSNTLNPCVSADYGEVEDYKLTVSASGDYTITCATTTGGTISADKTSADENDVITVTATPDTDYLLTALTYTPEGGSAQNIDITNMPYTFTMPADNVTVHAVFTANTSYNITYNVSPAGAGTATGPTMAVAGSTVTVPYTSNPGYVFDHITVTGVVTPEGNTFVMPAEDVTVTLYFVPVGSGTNGQVVTLDDREDHNWVYYKDSESPIHRLKPVDIKIKYCGNGTNNMTTTNTDNTPANSAFNANATGVQVNVGETEHTFVYYKTLENANEDGTGNYPYTLIPNPFQKRPTNGTSSNKYRGFYAWRVKSLTGVTIKSSDGSTTYGVNDFIYPEEEIQFVTTNEYNNEVEFEALWARAYVNATSASNRATNDGRYQNAYERNFKVVNSLTTYDYPVTISSINPDGSGNVGGVTRTSDYECSNDVKLENMELDMSDSYLIGNGYNFAIGRGVTNGNNDVAYSVYGYLEPSDAINGFTLRIESGRYTNAYLFYNSSTSQVSSANTWNMILGSDYDRANKDNSKLTIAGPVEVSYKVSSSSASAKINVIGLSGTFGADDDENELYMGYDALDDDNTAATPRFLEVLGGEYLGGISGGIENPETAATNVLTMRIKGGTIHRYVYGAGQFSEAVGTRKTIITGGNFDAWVAGGCYGTYDSGGATDGNTYVYFGGKANQTSNEGIFGAGYGSSTTGTGYYTVAKSYVVIADEAKVAGNVYAGGNNGYTTDNAEVYVKGTSLNVSGNIFGGANKARSSANTKVTVKGGTILGSVYGGANTSGTVSGQATVKVSGGTINGNVFGGGCGASTQMSSKSTVEISDNGYVAGNVFGGGELGKSTTSVINMYGGSVNGNIFGGALGTSGSVKMTGNKTVNIMGGAVKGSVYGGSRNANDSKDSYVNISGGTVSNNVYGGGFYGSIMGNTYVNIGKDAIENSPCAAANTDKPSSLSVGSLNIGGSVYAGSDWGEFTAGSTFTPSNISGKSNIYVDANGYSDGSLIIGNSIYGSGTSGDAGTSRDIIIRNYGTMTGTNGSSASRKLYTIQRADRLIIENSHIELTGKGNIASASTTEQFGVLNIFDKLRVVNGSTIVLSSPADSIKALGSYYINSGSSFDASPTYTVVNYDNLDDDQGQLDNKFYFKNGCYVNVNYKSGSSNLYGALEGFFHMTAENTSVGFAYARPKVVSGSIAASNGWSVQNTTDGGFVSYNSAENEYDINGNTTGTPLVQVQYILHPNTRDDSQYYRTWKLGTGTSKISKVITAEADGSDDGILTATVNAQLPYANGCYYKIVDVDWGDDAAMVNAGLYETDKYALCHKVTDYQMDYGTDTELADYSSDLNAAITAIQAAPNYTFGLTVLPEAGFQSNFGSSMPAALISPDAEDLWDTLRVEANTAAKPEVQFMLTYANNIDASASLSPVVITLAEYDCDNNKLQNVEVSLTIQTVTQIQDIETTVYAMMYGTSAAATHHDSSTVKVVLPKFVMASGDNITSSQFSITNIVITPVASSALSHPSEWFVSTVGNELDYGMTYKPAKTTDEINGWHDSHDITHRFDITSTPPTNFATADGREFTAIDFTVHYNGNIKFDSEEDELARVVFTVRIANFGTAGTNKDFNITVHIRRRGQSQNWYISSAGSNANSGHYPDQPKRSIKALMNAKPAYAVGDKIFIVGEININQPTVWEQPGDNSMGVTMQIYRYPGGHKLSDGNNDVTTAAPTGIQVGQYTGTLVNVNDELTLDWVYINGQHFADDVIENTPNFWAGSSLYDCGPDVNPGHNNVVAAAPVFNIAEGGSLNLREVVQISNNYVVSSAKTANAGGIYMGGEMNVEGYSIDVHENYLNGNKNNVYLPNADSKIGIGDYVLGDIGVTKTAMPVGASHTPIAYSIDEDDFVASDAYAAHSFVPDANGVFTYYNSETTDDTNPYTIYFAMTWVAAVTTAPDGFSPGNIDSPEDLAWFISYVNGYNNSAKHADASAIVTKDLDMKQYIWVPIGDAETAFAGSFDGGMYTIDNLHCNETDGITNQLNYIGMFGQTNGATVQNTFVVDVDFASSKGYMGGLIGKATSGTIEFCEAAGTLTALADLTSMGGVVGEASGTTMKALMSFTDMDGNNKTITNVGGVVGTGGTLQTALADNTFTDIANPKAIGNLAVNDAYTLSTTPTTLGSSVSDGYAPSAYTGSDATGKFSASDYSYGADNNNVTDGETKTPLVKLLNDNVVYGYKWIRAAGSNINGGYPIVYPIAADSLACVSIAGSKVLRFGELNQMISKYRNVEGAQVYMYNNDVIEQNITSSDKLKLYIDEHVALTQTASEVNAYVGITLDNSKGNGEQDRDWHMFSSTIAAGKTGLKYISEPDTYPTSENDLTFGTNYNLVQDNDSVYFPNGITVANGCNGKEFDIYSFYEEQYHWMNLKRNNHHWHQDNHDPIVYTSEPTFTVGKGYLIALGNKTTANNNLMQAYGTLNNGKTDITIPVTVGGAHLTGYNLLGNPFQSYLDFTEFSNTNSSIWGSESANKGYIIYDADKGGFICYGEGLMGVQPSIGSVTSNPYLHPHQGFLVIAENAGTVTFNNGMRSTTASNVEFRNEQPAYPVVNLFCTDSEGNNEITVVEIERPETAGVRKPKGLLNGDGQMYAHWNNTDYGLLFIDHTPDYVPMWFDAIKDAVFTMTWSTANDNFGYLHLVDNMTGADVDMLEADSYTFESHIDDMSARFRLVFKPLGIEEETTEQGENFAFFNGSELVVTGEGELSFIDLNGQVLATEYVSGHQTHIALPKVAVGMYMLRLSNANNVKVQKIVIRK